MDKGYAFFENSTAQLPALEALVSIYKTTKHLKREFDDTSTDDLEERLAKLEGVLDANDKLIAEITDHIETKLLK